MGPFRRLLAVLLTPIVLAACQTPAQPASSAAAVSVAAEQPARGPFVAAANPLAAEAGIAVLRRGGSAVDAEVAVQ